MKLTTKDGATVFYKASHMLQHQDVLQHLPAALQQIDTKGDDVVRDSIEMGMVVGQCICVATEPGDDIVFARRRGRRGLTRFVKNKPPTPSTKVSVILVRISTLMYRLLTSYIGDLSEREPDDQSFETLAAQQKAAAFWDTHALVWGEQAVHTNTIKSLSENTRC